MTKNNKLNNQEELFARDCKLMNLKYEYDGYTGTEKWAVITELTEEELWDKYPDIIRLWFIAWVSTETQEIMWIKSIILKLDV